MKDFLKIALVLFSVIIILGEPNPNIPVLGYANGVIMKLGAIAIPFVVYWKQIREYYRVTAD